ncbi:hypothetical protein V1512DRAFT_237765 [Lipomyces arxii]|uniref:uncharacterized protein n=1 Tax=Lipomyces arxii TaxID=56418 RepID=UPI0034CE6111
MSVTRRSKSRPPKKFECSGFGDCHMTFTRSEHLARHIRKHTGERPFRCTCGRSFSRLDNLRQHAHTVHAADTPVTAAVTSSTAAPLSAPLPYRHSRPSSMSNVTVPLRDSLPPPHALAFPPPQRFRPNQHRPGPLNLRSLPHETDGSYSGSPPISPTSCPGSLLQPSISSALSAHTPTSPYFTAPLSPASRGTKFSHALKPDAYSPAPYSPVSYSPAAPRFNATTNFTPPASGSMPLSAMPDADYRDRRQIETYYSDDEPNQRFAPRASIAHGISLPLPVPQQYMPEHRDYVYSSSANGPTSLHPRAQSGSVSSSTFSNNSSVSSAHVRQASLPESLPEPNVPDDQPVRLPPMRTIAGFEPEYERGRRDPRDPRGDLAIQKLQELKREQDLKGVSVLLEAASMTS